MKLRSAVIRKGGVISLISSKHANATPNPRTSSVFEHTPPSSTRLLNKSSFSTSSLRASPAGQCEKGDLFISSSPKPPKSEKSLLGPSLALAKRMLTYVQIITTPTADTPGTTLLLHFDNKRYILGHVAEGTQRAFGQRKVSIGKVEELFISGRVRVENGVPVTTLPSLGVHAGNNISYFLAACRRFVLRKGLPLRLNEIPNDPSSTYILPEPDWKDENINVWYMLLESSQQNTAVAKPRKRSHDEFRNGTMPTSPTSSVEDPKRIVEAVVKEMFDSEWSTDALTETTLHRAKLPAQLFVRDKNGHLQEYTGPFPSSGEEVLDIPVLVRKPWPGARISALPGTQPSRHSMCYIVKGHARRGRFKPQEAERLGVKKSDYKLLTNMQNVTAQDGTVVTPEMVLEETVAGNGFAVVDLPDISYIDDLVNRSEWSDSNKMKGISVIYWILGRDVASNARLQGFMRKMFAVRHIVTSPDNCPNMLALESTATQSYKLRCIDSDRFPLPSYSNEISLSGTATVNSPTYETGRIGKVVQFAPDYIHQDEKILPFPNIPRLARSGTDKEAMEMAAEARNKVSKPEFIAEVEEAEADIPNRDAEIITLGTGSALPSKYRNVSATLVRVPGYGNYLFDAGENTIGQLRRVFGDELPSVLRDLKVIWISHLHADHHLGTVPVIQAWHEETKRSDPSSKLVVASHRTMIGFLEEYADVEPFGFDRLLLVPFIKSQGSSSSNPTRVFSNKETEMFGLQKIEACWVNHCYGSMATAFTLPSGLKIAYSGDCRPSEAFVKIGKGATILIHESTFEDTLQGDAIAKKHSTMSEAINVGRRMGARRILLTHFSQRYQKIPAREEGHTTSNSAEAEDKAKIDDVILVAFDYMRVKLGDFRKAQEFLPAIQKLLEHAGEQ
ncbi:hypothetical protein GGS21DRAFT_494584 [Xylaria nigripes]|nr:hypothetical protein GGS21DRAFT_494584 [Xylaria nigripes]